MTRHSQRILVTYNPVYQLNLNELQAGRTTGTRGRSLRLAEAKPNLILCPYCGMFNKAPVTHCTSCHGHFDSLSRKVSQQHMGPWFIRDLQSPFRPGCSFDVIEKLCMSGKIKGDTILRGPTTRQFWQVAWRVPGVAHLIGFCHKCEEKLPGLISNCPHCHVTFARPTKREELGLDTYDPTVFEEVRKVRESATATTAGAAPTAASPATFSAPTPQNTTFAGTASFQNAGGVASMVDNQASADQAIGEVDDELSAMAWMTSSGEYHSEALPAERPSGGISPVVIGLITLNLLLIAVVAAVMMIDQGGETDTGINTGNGNGALIEPPLGTPQKARPKPRPATTGTGPDTAVTPTPQDPAGAPPTPTIDNGDGGASLFTPTPAATGTKPPPRNSGPSFFGIPIQMTPVEGLTEEQAADFNQRFSRAQAFYKSENYREALRLLESIRTDLPFGVTNKGLDDSIRQTEAKAREKANGTPAPADATPAPTPDPAAPETTTPAKPTEAQKKALDAFFE